MKKRVLFAIQGEGRGHMTQALALKEILEKHNFEIVAAIIGTSSRRKIPEFVKEELSVKIHEIESPNFFTDKEIMGLDISSSITKNLKLLPKFINNLKEVDSVISLYRPHLIINFYEPLLGLYNKFYRGQHKTICIGHQYLTLHPKYKLPEGFPAEKKSLQFFTYITSLNSQAKLGLSFYEFPDSRAKDIFVVPPLLRSSLKKVNISKGNYLLIYLLNRGYKSDVLDWHRKNPKVPIHCFSDDPEIDEEQNIDATLTFHQLNGNKFMDKMAGSMALVTTAGFESVCEAMYLNKPVLMVPVAKHYEQFVNSREAHSAGAGIYSDQFEINRIIDHIERGHPPMKVFKKWADSTELKIMRAINSVLNT